MAFRSISISPTLKAALIRSAARTGVYFLMIGFGAAFGYTVMSRMSLLIGRFADLIKFSSGDYGYATLILLVLTIVSLAVWEKTRRPSV